MDIVRLIDGDQLEQRLLDEAARIMAEDLYGKDRQRMARGLQKAAEICRATETAFFQGPIMQPIVVDTEEVARIVMEKIDAVQVVRCKECVYRPCKQMPYSYDHDYCSYGERNRDETD